VASPCGDSASSRRRADTCLDGNARWSCARPWYGDDSPRPTTTPRFFDPATRTLARRRSEIGDKDRSTSTSLTGRQLGRAW
jgi:hypothetical protein